MMDTPLVTVLLPCYNAMPYLTEALDSIINQTYTHLEILCINDGSTDETAKILEEYALKDSRIKVVHNETNLRLIRTLNKGIELAQGEYIARMDADDISVLNRIEKQVKIISNSNNEYDVISNGYFIIDETSKILSKSYPKCYSKLGCEFASFFITPITHASIMGKSSVLKENLYRDDLFTQHAEDYELWCRLILKGHHFYNISDLLYKVRVNLQSVSHKYESIQIKNFIGLVKQNFENMRGVSIDMEISKVIGLRIDKGVKFSHFIEALKVHKELTNDYLQKASINCHKEIQNISQYVLLSILFQTLKRGRMSIKLKSLLTLFSKWPFFLNKTVVNYMLNR